MQIALKTLDYLDVEYDFVVWKSALRELEYMRSLLQLTAIYGHFEVNNTICEIILIQSKFMIFLLLVLLYHR
jgi:hypothetical protein